MKVSGIICEYNPFHNGHLHHIQETRRSGATHIAAVMSGSFVQRGETAIIDKLERARLAVRSGADLVIELPVQYSLSSAENFASGAVWLLDSLMAVDELSFGSECGDLEKLISAMEITDRAAAEKADEITSIMEKGYTYPRALSSVVSGIDPSAASIISEPNNMLAIEYLRALRSTNIKPFTISRKGSDHDSSDIKDGFASASLIREKLLSGEDFDKKAYMPDIWADALERAELSGRIAKLDLIERVILYKVRTSSVQEIAQINDVAQGLENRIYGARMADSLEELLYTVKSKRYTMARIRRILLSLVLGITREDMTHMPPYGRILAFNDRGREILARAKGKARIPFGTSLAKLSEKNRFSRRFAELEGRASDLFGLALDTVTSAREDFRAKIMIDLE